MAYGDQDNSLRGPPILPDPVQKDVNEGATMSTAVHDHLQVQEERRILNASVHRYMVGIQGRDSGRERSQAIPGSSLLPADQPPIASGQRALIPALSSEEGEWCTLHKPGMYPREAVASMIVISKFMTRKLRHTNLVGRSEDARIEHKFFMRLLQAQFHGWAHRDLFTKEEMCIDELAQQQEKKGSRASKYFVPG